MDIKNNIDYRTYKYDKYNTLGDKKYDYATKGILHLCLPKVLFKGNQVLVSFLQAIDIRLVMMLKLVDKVKKFKYITWY